jgi:DNA-binding transcriptional ArsR family regulator
MMPESMDRIFEALAHPVRRRVLDVLKDRSGCTVGEVCDYFEMSRIGVMKHLRILENADLVVSRKNGRKRELYFNPVPIQMIYNRWTSEFSSLWASGITQIKYRIEAMQDERSQPAPKPAAKKKNNRSNQEKKRHA